MLSGFLESSYGTPTGLSLAVNKGSSTASQQEILQSGHLAEGV